MWHLGFVKALYMDLVNNSYWDIYIYIYLGFFKAVSTIRPFPKSDQSNLIDCVTSQLGTYFFSGSQR